MYKLWIYDSGSSIRLEMNVIALSLQDCKEKIDVTDSLWFIVEGMTMTKSIKINKMWLPW